MIKLLKLLWFKREELEERRQKQKSKNVPLFPELVRTLEETEGKTQLDWDATSDDGKKLASGVYIWVSTNQSGKHKKGKFAIIR